MDTKGSIREKPHRLPREYYQGEVTVAYTACISDRQTLFQKASVVKAFVSILQSVVERNDCIVLIYCFMPDHLHLIINGLCEQADTWKAMVNFKQQSGYWLRKNHPSIRWQKGFYDHIIRKSEDMVAQVMYIAENPVRKGLVVKWDKYPRTGTIGIDFKTVLEGNVTK